MPYLITKFGFAMLCSAFVASFIPLEFSFIAAAVSFIGFLGFISFGKSFRERSAFFLAAAIGFSVVAVKLHSEYYPASFLDGMTATITGTVTEISSGSGNPVYTVKTDSVNIDGAPQKITVRLSGWDESSAGAFDKISCDVAFMVPENQNPEDFFTDHSRGISVYAYTKTPINIIGKDDSSAGYFVYTIRDKISSVIYRYFMDWHAPFMEKLLIGTGEGIESSVTNAFRRSGMSHILAISGMHMVIIVGLFEKILGYRKSKGKFHSFETVLLIAVTAAYMFIGGLGMSVLRSGFMLVAHYFSKLFFSGSKSLDNLGIAVAVVILLDPLASCDAGFLMSVFSCFAISAFAKPFKTYLANLFHAEDKPFPEFLIESFCVSFVAFLAVLPVSAVVFGKISLVSPFSNLFAGFFAQYSIIFGVITVACGLVPFLEFISAGMAFAAMLCNGIVLKTAEFFADLPFAYISSDDLWFFIWLFGSAVLIIIPILCSGGFSYFKHSVLVSVFVLLFGIFLDFIFFSGVSEIRITALEHGTAITCSKDGESVLIANGLSSDDRFNLDFTDSGYDSVISINAVSSAAEYELIKSSEPLLSLLSTEDSVGRFDGSLPVSPGKVSFSETDYAEIIPESAVCFETNGVTVLYIFEECDIMEVEPKFRRADIIILDGVSPEDFAVLRCDYLILREKGGFYSGTNEIIVLKDGEISFFAYGGNLKKGSDA
ncbi:MAG: ComEC/Rec2 family competence protein [Oscillospiraceae bacterium]|nr:ComEC/Rec2 family competence protein [Oscillospiraceae bacterium]